MSVAITVHVRVNDAATAKATPCRLRIVGPDGQYFAPFGRDARFRLGVNEDVGGQACLNGKQFAYGACEIRLPTGVPLEIEISKGIEFEPLRESVTLGPGQMALRFAIHRWIDLRSEGWLSADSRCHFLSPHAALLEAAVENLDLVHLLATEQFSTLPNGVHCSSIPNLTAFSGQKAALEGDGRSVVVNTLHTHPVLGKLGLLNCHRPIFPLSFGRDDEGDDWSLCDWCDQCHRKKGLVVWVDGCDSSLGTSGGEALIAAILGKIDAIEIDARESSHSILPFWYQLLDADIRVPLCGSSGKESNAVALGSTRTYTQVGDSTSLNDWVEHTRLGHTYITNGPLLDLRVNGEPIGSRIRVRPDESVSIHASVRSRVPFDRLELIANGETIASAGSHGFPFAASIDIERVIHGGGWIGARCTGAAKSAIDLDATAFAHTSACFIEVEGQMPRKSRKAIDSLRLRVEEMRKWIQTMGRFAREKSKDHLLGLCDEAMGRLGVQS